jgi:membrane protease YdiL (CAAX protease family)
MTVATPTQTSDKLAVWEILSVVTSCVIAEWIVLGFAGRSKLVIAIPVLLAVVLMIISHRERQESFKDVGFRLDNFFASCRLLLAPTALAIALILVGGWLAPGATHLEQFRLRYLALPIWALFQQYALNGFINRRAQLAFGKGLKSIALVAVIFALLHLPNPFLAVVTLIGGFVWAAVYQRQPNLFALALSHSLTSVTMALSLSPGLLNNLRVGFKYFG